jgi:hypothetical protein
MTTNIHLILEREHLENLIPLFEKQGVTDEILDTITDEDLRTLGVEKLGERRRVLLAFGEGSGGPFDLTATAQVGGGFLPQDSEFSGQKVDPFRIGKYPVTQLEWERVRIWAMAHGFKLEAGEGNGSRHPITHVSWYDAVKWCNAKSAMEDLKPVFSINGKIYQWLNAGRDEPRSGWLPPADRDGMGVGGARRHFESRIPIQRKRQPRQGRVARKKLEWWSSSRGTKATQRTRNPRHERQCLGMVLGQG